VLDEPSAGLHADEIAKLLDALGAIVDAGGSVLVVEHDLDVVRAADFVVDLGPGAGANGRPCGGVVRLTHWRSRTREPDVRSARARSLGPFPTRR